MHTYQTKIKLHETDAAGLLFFGNQFKIIHDAYEGLLERIGFGFPQLIREKKIFLPIVHSESDYKSPLFVGDLIEVQVFVQKVGKTSFTLFYKLLDTSQKVVGTAQTVHVTINSAEHKKIPLPSELRAKLEAIFAEDQAPST